MTLNEGQMLAALRGIEPIAAICRAANIAEAELIAAQGAYLRERAAIGNESLAAAVGGSIEIMRDRSGLPHIYAHNSPDVFFGLGYAMAQDRLWQMDRLRRRALGRQAEILGAAYVASDLAHRTVGIDRLAQREPSRMDGTTYRAISGFVDGINRHVGRAGKKLPIEFLILDYEPEPFTVADIVAIARGFWWSLNGRIDRIMAAEAARLLPEAYRKLYLTPEAAEHFVLPDGGDAAAGSDDQTGSNNWAVAGARSANGKALLAGDPHQPFWVPGSWYEYALHGPEDNAAGAGHPGFPGLWWGSNGRIAWALTNNMATTRDLYREEIDPRDPQLYRDGDVWRRFETHEATIAVRGEAARTITIRETVRGPIVNALVPTIEDDGGPPLSLRWVGAEHLDDLRASIAVSRAQDWKQFRAALSDWSVAVFNFVYADAEGHVGYQMAGRVPLRGRMVPGLRDANEPADRWRGYIPYDALPRSYLPSSGYVASANQRIVPPDYPWPIYGAYSQGHRGIRIGQAFAPAQIDNAMSVALQNDVKSVRAERSVPHILRALAAHGDATMKIAEALLAAWDHRYTLDQAAPTLFESFMVAWQRRVLARHVPARLIDLTMQQTGLAVSLLEDQTLSYFARPIAEEIVAAMRETLAALKARLGPDPARWTWDRVHIAHWRHPLSNPGNMAAFDIGPAPVGGGSHTVCNTGGELPPHAASSGAEYRIIVDFAEPDSFLAIQNIGNSGVPGSPHYRDQFEAWRTGAYHRVQLKRDGVEAACVTRTVIAP